MISYVHGTGATDLWGGILYAYIGMSTLCVIVVYDICAYSLWKSGLKSGRSMSKMYIHLKFLPFILNEVAYLAGIIGVGHLSSSIHYADGLFHWAFVIILCMLRPLFNTLLYTTAARHVMAYIVNIRTMLV